MTIMKASTLRKLKLNADGTKQRPDKRNDHDKWFKDRAERIKRAEAQEREDAKRRGEVE